LNSNFTFEIHNTTKTLPKKWDTLATTNIFLSTAYLKALAIGAPKNMTNHYIALFNNTELIGIALSQFIDLSQVSSFGERDNCFKTKIRKVIFKNFCANVLFIGNNMLTGQNAYSFSPAIAIEESALLLNKAAKELRKILLKKGLNTHLTVFKDFDKQQSKAFEQSALQSYFKFTTQPNMIFNINPNWNTMEDYIAALNKKYRDQYKRVRKKSDGIIKRKMALDEIILYNDRIHELYMTVAKNAPFNTFYLPEKHFEILKYELKDHFLFYGYFIGEELIGFNTLFKNGNDIDTYFLGYDHNHQKDKMLYLNMLYDMIGYSINKGYQHIIMARTALEIKSSVGATPLAMYGFIQHRNKFIDWNIANLFKYFEPEMPWKERSPFK
jgi:predicted N-acyltransferase